MEKFEIYTEFLKSGCIVATVQRDRQEKYNSSYSGQKLVCFGYNSQRSFQTCEQMRKTRN